MHFYTKVVVFYEIMLSYYILQKDTSVKLHIPSAKLEFEAFLWLLPVMATIAFIIATILNLLCLLNNSQHFAQTRHCYIALLDSPFCFINWKVTGSVQTGIIYHNTLQ